MLADGILLYNADCRDVLRSRPDNSVDSVVTDPPYALVSITKRFGKEGSAPLKGDRENGPYRRTSAGFMGKQWDTGDTAHSLEFWRECLRVLKPGGHVVAFAGTRTYHRLAVAIEDAGFEIRDMVQWLYGSGFPKSLDVSKGIDRAAGAEREIVGVSEYAARRVETKNRPNTANIDGYANAATSANITAPATDAAKEWQGWGTALKPANEPICLARKPLSEGTVAANVLRWGTGAINVDGCRVGTDDSDVTRGRNNNTETGVFSSKYQRDQGYRPNWNREGKDFHAKGSQTGRWPANVITDGSEEVVRGFPHTNPSKAAPRGGSNHNPMDWGNGRADGDIVKGHSDNGGSAARFFFNAGNDIDTAWLAQNLPSDLANDVPPSFSLDGHLAVSALSNAVAQSTQRLALQSQSVRAQNTSVSAQQLRLACEAVTETIQNIERRFSLGLPPGNATVKLGDVICAATQKQTGITTIILSLLKSGRFAAVATFNIIEMSAEAGAWDSAPRFHYSAKASKADRAGSKHPTVKPIKLMQYLARLVTPPGGTLLDPFAGSGTTGMAALREGFNAILCEREAEYAADIRSRFSEPETREETTQTMQMAMF